MHKRRRVGEDYQLAPGECLRGRTEYRIVRCLGGGSYSLAYQVIRSDGETLFLKELREPEHPADTDEYLRIYQREVDVLRRLGNHELVPRLHDAFSQDGFHYLVQDYIGGEDLETIVRSGRRLDQRTLMRWCACLCRTLAFYHSRNVVHHDLKPSNIRLNDDGDPIILDFGAARWYRRPDEVAEDLYGTEGYLAPEYAEISAEDLATGMRMDVFAMGRILVELLVGKRLSQEDIDRRTQQLYGSILHSQTLDDRFVRAVFRSVDYDPTRRYANGMEMERDVTAATPPAGRVRPRRLVLRQSAGRWPECSVVVYNVGGGALSGNVRIEGEGLWFGATPAERTRQQPITRNRTVLPVTVVGTPATDGRIVCEFPDQPPVIVPVTVSPSIGADQIEVSPRDVRIAVRPGNWGRSMVVFENRAAAPVAIEIVPPGDPPVGVDPLTFTLAPRERQEVTLAIDAAAVGNKDRDLAIEWRLADGETQRLPVQVRVRKPGLIESLLRRGP